MVFSAPWSKYTDIVALNPVIYCLGINSMGLSLPWANSLDIIAVQKAKIN